MKQKLWKVLAVAMVIVMALASCKPAATPVAEPTAVPQQEEVETTADFFWIALLLVSIKGLSFQWLAHSPMKML